MIRSVLVMCKDWKIHFIGNLSVSTFFHRSGRCWKKEGFLFGRHVPWSSLAELQFWRLIWISLADWHSFERLQQLPSLCRNWFVNTCTYFSFKVYYMSHTQIFIGCSGLKINQIISTVASFIIVPFHSAHHVAEKET